MSNIPQIQHLPAVASAASGWSPLDLGEFTAGEFRAVPFPSDDERFVEKLSVWRHDEGELPYSRPTSSEFFYLVEGTVRIEAEAQAAVEVGAGDAVVVPVGFAGTWHTIEPVVKISISTTAHPAD